jgi:GrpB-like predicted nucleotidyltransferase (UPF0157 family)
MIPIVEHQAEWKVIAAEWGRKLQAEFTPERVSVEPIGAAAVETLAGRDEIDLLATAQDEGVAAHIVDSLTAQRYQEEPAWRDGLCWLVHPNTNGRRIRILVTTERSEAATEATAIRDHLRAHPLVAASFGALKRQVAADCGDQIDSYEAGKKQFFSELLNAARASCAQPK